MADDFVRVLCEHCQTPYNIPIAKLAKPVSQATCKVCQNKIVIRRPEPPAFDTGGMSSVLVNHQGEQARPPTSPSQAGMTRPDDLGGNETELSNSWRDGIVDNRSTIAMLKKTGIPVPHDSATAAGPKVQMPLDEEAAEPTAIDDGLAPRMPLPTGPTGQTAPTARSPQPNGNPGATTRTVMPTNPAMADVVDRPTTKPADDKLELDDRKAIVRPSPTRSVAVPAAPARTRAGGAAASSDDPASSAFVSILAALAAGAVVAQMIRLGGWSSGLGGLAAFLAASFATSACLFNGVIRRRGILGVMVILFLAGTITLGAGIALVATGGDRSRALLSSRSFLQPLVRYLPGAPGKPPDAAN